MWMRQQLDTTQLAIQKDTPGFKNTGVVMQDTSPKEKTGILSLDDIENIMIQGERRLKKIDSIAVQKKKKSQIVVKNEPAKRTGTPDTTLLYNVIGKRADNSGEKLIQRFLIAGKRISADTNSVYRPVNKKTRIFHVTTEQQAPSPVIMKRKPAYFREDWFLIVLVVSFLLITWTKIRFGKFLNQTLSGLWNYKNAFSLFRNRSSLYQRTSSLLFLNFLLSGGMFVYLFMKVFDIHFTLGDYSPVMDYFVIILMLAGIYLYLFLIIKITGFITLNLESFSEFSHFTTLFFHNAGVYLFPLNAVIPYVYKGAAVWLLYAGLGIITVFYLLRIIKLTSIFIRERFSIFYLFLYLCALEILPIIIFILLIFR